MATDKRTQAEHNPVFLFKSTHAALDAEEAIMDAGIWCDVVPRPPGTASSLCGLAIEVLGKDESDVAMLLEAAGIAFETYRPAEADDGN